jgi:hypothetical protein
MTLHHRLFPGLQQAVWTYINLGELSRELPMHEKNPLLDPEKFKMWLRAQHDKLCSLNSRATTYSYGGYLEDRSRLWRGHYMKPGCAWHLGIDFNVPTYTPVHMPTHGELISATHDPDQNGGWGGKIIFRLDDGNYLILAHLRLREYYETGSRYPVGHQIGFIADPQHNGCWHPHLHVQIVHKDMDPNTVDGYGALYVGVEYDFPRPDTNI